MPGPATGSKLGSPELLTPASTPVVSGDFADPVARGWLTTPAGDFDTEESTLTDMPKVPEGSGLMDRVLGKVKEVVGTVTGNQDLRDEGRLHEDKAEAERQAQIESAAAAQLSAEAEMASNEAELAAERQRLVAEEIDAAERKRLEREAAAAESRVEAVHDARRDAVDRAEHIEKAAASSHERAAAVDHQAAERLADQVAAEAEESRRRAATLAAEQHTDQGAC